MPLMVLVLGGGQLGSRYLQGLLKHHVALRIFVVDPLQQSLDLSAQRMYEIDTKGVEHTVSFHQTYAHIPTDFDLAIVATTANVRPDVVLQISSRGQVRYWVLEKVLAQSELGLQQLTTSLADVSQAWVNTPRRMMPWHREIKANLGITPVEMSVVGGQWNLASNAIHFLDLLAWWTDESLVELSTALLEPDWRKSKRQGFLEISGVLEAHYSRGSTIRLHSSDALIGQPTTISLAESGGPTWNIVESLGTALRSDGLLLPGKIISQSILTTSLVDTIFKNGRCDLPSFEESAAMHRTLLTSLQIHFVKTHGDTLLAVPIT